MIPGGRPGAELLTVVAHRADALAPGRGVFAQILNHALNCAEGDAIAKPLLGAEDGERLPLVFGEVGAPECIFWDGGGAEVGVIEDRPAIAAIVQCRWEGWLPDALGEPRTLRRNANELLDALAHASQLRDAVGGGE